MLSYCLSQIRGKDNKLKVKIPVDQQFLKYSDRPVWQTTMPRSNK